VLFCLYFNKQIMFVYRFKVGHINSTTGDEGSERCWDRSDPFQLELPVILIW